MSSKWQRVRAAAVVLTALGVAGVGASSARAQVNIVACNAQQIYDSGLSPGCGDSFGNCTINEIIICDQVICGSACTYDFEDRPLFLQGSYGRFQVNAFSSPPPSLTVISEQIMTGSGTTIVRFTSQGGGSGISLVSTGFDGAGISVIGRIINTGSTAGNVSVNGGPGGGASVGFINVDATAAGAKGGNVTIYGNDFANSNGAIQASGPGGGGKITIRSGNDITLAGSGSILAQSTGSGFAAGEIVVESFGYDFPPTITVDKKLAADVPGSTVAANAGAIDIGPASGDGSELTVNIDAALVVGTGASQTLAGNVTIKGETITMSTGGSIDATAGSTTKHTTTGGTVTITSEVGGAITLDDIEARGQNGGSVHVRSDGPITLNKDVSVASNHDTGIVPGGRGGVIVVRSWTLGPATDTWDCQIPLDPCIRVKPEVVPANCTASVVQINDDLLAHGLGAAGIGGVITLEAPIVRMRNGTGQKKLQANATSADDGVTTGTGGRIRARARSSMFVAQNAAGTVQHKGRALPDDGLATEIAGTLPLGGLFNPGYVLLSGIGYNSCPTP